MLVILVMGITTLFLNALSGTAINNKRNLNSAQALAQAKEALIGYAVTYGDTHAGETDGYLPCPDPDGAAGINSEGSSETCGTAGANILGRLPWRTLELAALTDGAGECLWYAVSGNYKNNPKAGITMNWDTPAQLHVFGSDGNEILANEIVALVIAPGTPTNGNSERAGNAAPTCGGNFDPAAYLEHDTQHGFNNAAVPSVNFILPHDHRDANGNITLSSNDQFAFITRQDIWSAVQNRIAREAKQCLDDYAQANNRKYPWAVPLTTQTTFSPLFIGSRNTRFGRLPTRPNVQTQALPYIIVTLQARFSELWVALSTFAANRTSTNRSIMRSKALAAYNSANTVKDYYDGDPLEDPARNLRDAADAVYDNLSTSSSSSTIANHQQALVDAAKQFSATLSDQFTQASGMSDVWPANCSLFSSPRWDHWRDLLFFQVANGYSPSGVASCGPTCLNLKVDDDSQAGTGSYRGVVIAAGPRLTASRTSSISSDYLESANLLPSANVSNPYLTYRITAGNYQSNNDRVLCLDGKVNCP